MLQAKLSPRRETVLFSTDFAWSERSSMRCPSPAGEEAAASRAMPVRGESVAMGGKRERIGKSSRLGSTACASFAICSPLEIRLLPGEGGVKIRWDAGRRANAPRLWAAAKLQGAAAIPWGSRRGAKVANGRQP